MEGYVENRGMRVNMNKSKVMISGERQKLMQKTARWPCGVCYGLQKFGTKLQMEVPLFWIHPNILISLKHSVA